MSDAPQVPLPRQGYRTDEDDYEAAGFMRPSPRECPVPMDPNHYPYQPSDWGDFEAPVGGCVECGIMPTRKNAPPPSGG